MTVPMKRLAAFALTMALAACNGTTGPSTSDFASLPADQVLVGVEHATTVDGIRRARILSDTTHVFNDSSAVKLIGVNLETYDVNGGVTAKLTSKYGSLDTNTNKMVARGSVVLTVTGPQAQVITTEELHYDPQSKQVWSDVQACQRKGGQTLCGSSFRADDQFNNVTVIDPRGRGIQIR